MPQGFKAGLVLILMALGVAPGLAREYSLPGRWVTSTGESAYLVSYCGDGTALCGKLVWLREDAISDRTRPYLGKYLVRDAPKVAPNKWTAHAIIFGYSIGGEVLLDSDTEMTLHGCWLFIFCKTFHLHKVSPAPDGALKASSPEALKAPARARRRLSRRRS